MAVSCASYSYSGKVTKTWGPAQTAVDTTCPTAATPVPVTDTAYDDLDRPTRTTQYLTVAEGGNRITDTAYNLDDTVASVSRGVGTALAQTYASYTYTNNGLVATVKDAKNNLTAYQYDGFDRKLKTQYPSPTTVNTVSATDYEQYSYDNNANLTTLRKRSGENITLAYDNLNRLSSRVYPTAADNVSFSYDLLGRRLAATTSTAADNVAYGYDNAGRLTSTTANGKTLSYQVDAAGNRTRTTWPEDTPFYVNTTYDALNRPTVISELGTSTLASYAYDDLSRRTVITRGNASTTTTYGYTTQGALGTLTHNLTGTAQDESYTYTRNQVQEIGGTTWANDAYQWGGTGVNVGTSTYVVNGLNQYSNAAGSPTTHDANGNVKVNGFWTYAYDLNNRLTGVSRTQAPATSALLKYDAEGRLRQAAITTTPAIPTVNMMYDGQDLAAEYDASGMLVRRYVHGPGVDEPLVVYEGATTANKSWFYADHLGSIVGLADAAGTSTAIYSYGPYGEPNVYTGQRFRYTGQQLLVGLQMYYYKGRIYSAVSGRFLQTDPIGTADDLNLYSYVGNNPVNFRDPRGLSRAQAVMLACGIGCDVASLFPDGAPIVSIGRAYGGVAAAAVGWATGDQALYDAAVEGLSESRTENLDALAIVASVGRAKAPRAVATPLYSTTKVAQQAAEALGFKRINETGHGGEAIFNKGNQYLSRDLDGHKGGAWKMGSSVKALGSKETRSGTYDANLNRVGD